MIPKLTRKVHCADVAPYGGLPEPWKMSRRMMRRAWLNSCPQPERTVSGQSAAPLLTLHEKRQDHVPATVKLVVLLSVLVEYSLALECGG
jgi:hypothetical protein